MMRQVLVLCVCLLPLVGLSACGHDHDEEGHDHNNGAEEHDHNSENNHDHGDENNHDHGDHNNHDHGDENNGGDISADALAVAACEALAQDPVMLTAAATPEESVGVMVSSSMAFYQIALPEDGPGFVQIELGEHSDWGFALRHTEHQATLLLGDGTEVEIHAASASLSCGDDIASDSRQHIHVSEVAMLRVEGGEDRTVWLRPHLQGMGHE